MQDTIIYSEIKEYETAEIMQMYRAAHGERGSLTQKEARFYALLRQAEKQIGSIRNRIALVLQYANDLTPEEKREATAFMLEKLCPA